SSSVAKRPTSPPNPKGVGWRDRAPKNPARPRPNTSLHRNRPPGEQGYSICNQCPAVEPPKGGTPNVRSSAFRRRRFTNPDEIALRKRRRQKLRLETRGFPLRITALPLPRTWVILHRNAALLLLKLVYASEQ